MQIEIIVRSEPRPAPNQYDEHRTERDVLAQARLDVSDPADVWEVYRAALAALTPESPA